MAATVLSFRGREHSDRRYAPSEHRLRERSPESMTTGHADCDERVIACIVWGYGFRARWQVGTADLRRRRSAKPIIPIAQSTWWWALPPAGATTLSRASYDRSCLETSDSP